MHLIQDLHQPLHNLANIGESCKSDLGGNLTCLQRFNSSCKMNLHALWDIGFGVFDSIRGVSIPKGESPPYSLTFRPSEWSKETIPYFDHVYQYKNSDYIKKSREIVALQVQKTVRRLTAYLQRHHDKKT